MEATVLLECGSNSLKVHRRPPGATEIASKSFRWRLGHDVYGAGALSTDTLEAAVDVVNALVAEGFEREALLAVATEAFRDAENREAVVATLRSRMGVDLRVLSGREEASLLAEAYSRTRGTLPAFLCDIGGGSVQLVYISEERTVLRDSLPLGAIRLHHMGAEDGKPWAFGFVREHVETQLEEACLMSMDRLVATGGTAKAVAKTLGSRSFGTDRLEALLDEVRRNGPPPTLGPERREVFLPGLLVLLGLVRRLKARTIEYESLGVGRMFLQRLIDRLGPAVEGAGKAILFRDMRITNIRPRL